MAVLYCAHTWPHDKSCWYCGDLIRSYSRSSNSNKWHVLLHKQLATLDHLSLAYYNGNSPFSNMTSYQKTDILRYIMLPSECFPTMLAMQFSYIPVMSILVIWALIQLVLPPYHSDGRLKEPISPYAMLRSGILRDDQIVDCSYLTFETFCLCFRNISIPFFISLFVFVFYFFIYMHFVSFK